MCIDSVKIILLQSLKDRIVLRKYLLQARTPGGTELKLPILVQ
jgi:hypothetical protein